MRECPKVKNHYYHVSVHINNYYFKKSKENCVQKEYSVNFKLHRKRHAKI